MATLVSALVQVIVGLVSTKRRKLNFRADPRTIYGSAIYGVFVFVGTALLFFVFQNGGDVGINTFIITLAIIPGAIIDQLIFKDALNARQWIGFVVAIFAGYSVIGWPSLSELTNLPVWIWLSIAAMFMVVGMQTSTRYFKDVDPYLRNFWGGLTVMALALLTLIFTNTLQTLVLFEVDIQKIYLLSLILGVITIGIWNFSLLSYKMGVGIAQRDLVMNGIYLSTTMLLGTLVFGELFTVGKLCGVAVYLVAFYLITYKNTPPKNAQSL